MIKKLIENIKNNTKKISYKKIIKTKIIINNCSLKRWLCKIIFNKSLIFKIKRYNIVISSNSKGC